MSAAAKDACAASRLVAFGMRPKQLPARDVVYADLIVRYAEDDEFKALVQAVASGFGLVVLAVTRKAGIVLGVDEDSVFSIKMDEYSKRTTIGVRRSTEKVLHSLIHMAAAALAFPRPDDLANDSYVGRVSVEQIDAAVRQACRTLDDKVNSGEDAGDPLDDAPELEQVWRVYARKPETAKTKDGRLSSDTTRAMTVKALKFLSDQGFLVHVNNESGGTYRSTPRYQVQVRELASVRAFQELLSLGVVAVADGTGSLQPTSASTLLGDHSV